MRGQLVVGLNGLPDELLPWCFGLVLGHLHIVVLGFCRDGYKLGSRCASAQLGWLKDWPPRKAADDEGLRRRACTESPAGVAQLAERPSCKRVTTSP
jgi:hypothetical protein